MDKLPNVGEADVSRALQLLPGISGNESSSGLFVRDGTPDQNLILLDGFNIYHVDHFFGFFSAFNINAIKDVQMYKGCFPAKYGGRTSSVLELTGKSGDVQGVRFGTGASFLSANAAVEIPFIKDKGSILLVARRSYTDVLESPLYKDIFDLLESDETTLGPYQVKLDNKPSFYFWDANGKISLRPNDKDVFTYSFYYGKDFLDNSANGAFEVRTPLDSAADVNMDNDDLSGWGSWGTSAKWSRQWNDKYYTNLVAAYSDYYSNREDSNNIHIRMEVINNSVIPDTTIEIATDVLVEEDNNVRDFTTRLENIVHLSKENSLEYGAQVTWTNTLFDLSVKLPRGNLMDTVMDGNAMLYAGYIQDKWRLFNRLTLLPGIRFSYFDETEKPYFEPRISMQLELIEHLRFKTAWGLYYQFVNRILREDVMSGSRDFWVLSDVDDPKVSSAQHIISGLSYDHPFFLIDVEVYYKILGDLSIFSQRQTSQGPGGNYFIGGDGIAKGIDLLLQKKTGNYTGWIGYSLSRVEHTFPLINEGKPFPASHDQTHEIKFINSFSIKHWDFSATWIYGTGKPFTKPDGQYLMSWPDGTVDTIVHVSAMNAQRLPDYHRLDLSVTFNFNIRERFNTSLGVSVFNVYNRENVWNREFEYIEKNLVQTDNLFMGITPSLFLNFKFK